MYRRPFKLIQENGKLKVQVQDSGVRRNFVSIVHHQHEQIFMSTQTPEEITAMVLRKMKEDAESFLGQKVAQAVITAPARTSRCLSLDLALTCCYFQNSMTHSDEH